MDDLRAVLDEESMERIDVGPLARPEADVVEPDAELGEALVPVAVLRPDDAEGGAAADAVEHPVRVDDGAEAEEAEQALVERKARVEVADGEEDVRDAVDLHGRLIKRAGWLEQWWWPSGWRPASVRSAASSRWPWVARGPAARPTPPPTSTSASTIGPTPDRPSPS